MTQPDDILSRYFGVQQKPDPIPVYPKMKDVAEHIPKYAISTLTGMADGNIDDIEQMIDILKILTNAAWGKDWGELTASLKMSEDSSSLTLPQILVDINDREISEGTSPKPKLMSVEKEIVDGKETGDSFLVYRQFFDCLVEFDFFGRTNLEAKKLQKRLESLLMVYTGYLKRKGISELFFMKELPPELSLKYINGTPMRVDVYYVKFESITAIRQSVINQINTEIGVNQISSDKIQQQLKEIKASDTQGIELDFFPDDTGVKLVD